MANPDHIIDLDVECWRAVESVRQNHIDQLLLLGVPGSALASLGSEQPPFGVMRVAWLGDGLFEPSPDGDLAAISPVCAYESMGLLRVVDLIAWRASSPDNWCWRIGHSWALGDHLLDDDLPVDVVATPLDWLKLGGNALCILDWSAPMQCWSRLRSGPALQFTDEALRRRVRNALVANVALPPMETINAA